MKRLAVALFLLSFVAAWPATAKDKDPAGAEAKLRPDAAKALVEFAGWCAGHGAKKDGTAAIEEAAALDASASKLAETKSAIEALTEEAADAADAVAKERKTRGPKIAASYDRLAAVEHDAKDAGRFEDYVFRGLAWDPTPSRLARIRRSVDDAIGGGRLDEGGRLLVRLKRADPEGVAAGKYERTEIDLATKDALLLGSDVHQLVGYVALPKDWTKGKSYPVLVGVEGAGCNFLGYCRGFAGARGGRPVIVVAPITLSNTNDLKPETYPCYPRSLLDEHPKEKLVQRLEFDARGIDALLEVVRRRFGGEEKVFLTGFSGGGQYTYWKLFQDPAHVRGAAPACGNFGGAGLERAPGVGPDGGPPVHLFTGEKDPHRDQVFGVAPGITGQTDRAEENLRKLGYTHVVRTDVKGAGHDSFPVLVWKFVDQVLGAK
jgi:dienelactone hydrolase